MNNYYSNNSDNIIPYYSTNVIISGNGSVGNFLIKSDSIQSFDLNLPINRKTIYSLGKKYPVKRKALFPSEASFNFSNRISNFEVSGQRANLKDFLNSDEIYTINISGKDYAENNFGFQIDGAKLTSQSYNSSINSDIIADLGFSFELNKFSDIPSIAISLQINGDSESVIYATLNGRTVTLTRSEFLFKTHPEVIRNTDPFTITFQCEESDAIFVASQCYIAGGTTNFNPINGQNQGSISVSWDGFSSEIVINLEVVID